MRLSKTMLLSVAALALEEFKEFNAKSLFSNLVKFKSRQELVDSYVWTYLISDTYVYSPETSSFYIEDTKSVLVMAEPKSRDLITMGKHLFGLGSGKMVHFSEIDLGNDIYSVGADYFPLLTASAKFSSGIAIAEREIGQAYTVSFTPGASREFHVIFVGFEAAVSAAFAETYAKRETITCMANPGGRVQLQVSNSMMHFPKARIRKATYSKREKTFKDDIWEKIKSTVFDEEHLGALFYESFMLGKHRCVTDEEHFEDIGVRKWIEWRKPY